tara:strand:+ start:41 stop:391 length:351 start_codon:yes stop_codon:yes gene_type:complete
MSIKKKIKKLASKYQKKKAWRKKQKEIGEYQKRYLNMSEVEREKAFIKQWADRATNMTPEQRRITSSQVFWSREKPKPQDRVGMINSYANPSFEKNRRDRLDAILKLKPRKKKKDK